MTRAHMLTITASVLSVLLLHAQAMAADSREPARAAATATPCACNPAEFDETKCDSRITNVDGEDGKDNASPDSGNGGKGGTIKNADKCSDKASANGGNGGSGNRGAKSGNGGKGGNISF